MTGIMPLRGAWPEGAVKAHRRVRFPAPVSRRSIFRVALAGATSLGLVALTVFPAARTAFAAGYRILPYPCPSYATDHNCSPGCGPSRVCLDCCDIDGWHRRRGDFRLRPNQCASGVYDGWLWAYSGPCGRCRGGVTYRCHDGYRRVGHWWSRTICRATVRCRRPVF
ncbi:hypothetical protein [Rhizohabitans arisaemae]|uniref:hypothetical protein n=1 Tax=Rhizohabitans arisaemae TaxID=2720610 RepID=UPI0024B0966F|nr:hypothetical protein [Rhizohabitans arisaemae]